VGLRWGREGFRVLVVSTDPAHSLGDALGIPLSGEPVTVARNVDAMEVDPAAALDEWRSAVGAFDAEAFGARYGKLGAEAVRSLGVDELLELAGAPPPGVDEVVALARVVAFADDDRYDRIIVDTAPTGHALRLLDLPRFADDVLGRLLSLRDAAAAVAGVAGGLLGGLATVAADVDAAAEKLAALRSDLARVEAALKDTERTEFLAVTAPTSLAVADRGGIPTVFRDTVRQKAFRNECFGTPSPSLRSNYGEPRNRTVPRDRGSASSLRRFDASILKKSLKGIPLQPAVGFRAGRRDAAAGDRAQEGPGYRAANARREPLRGRRHLHGGDRGGARA
jgi:arsenite-transporting ATPase